MYSRRTFLRLAGTALAATPFVPALARSGPRPTEGTFTALRNNVGTFTERGGTIGWLANDDALVVVDTQSPETAPHCWAGLQERTEQPLDAVINTHHHGDHTGGNGYFADHTDRIVGHANVPPLQQQAAGDDRQPVVPTATYEDEWSDTIGSETIHLRHYGPAHTGGDTVVTFERANIVHMGDLVFNRAYPFIDINGGADTQNWITTLETVHETYDAETIFIHGHANPAFGVTGSRDDLLVMRDFLAALNEYVAQQRQQGASLDEMQEAESLNGFSDFQFDWPLPLSRCIEAVYREQTDASSTSG